MKVLHRYLLRQISASLLLTVAVFTFIFLLGSALKELLPLLVNQGVPFLILVKAVALLIPFVAVFALPIGMLTATLLVFGRFSADQELTAARASGVSLASLANPVLLLSLLLCAASAIVNLEIAPRCRVAYNQLRFDLRSVLSAARLPEGQPIEDFKGYMLYFGKNRNGNLTDIFLCQLTNETDLAWTVWASRGRIVDDRTNQRIILDLFDTTMTQIAAGVPGIVGHASSARYFLEMDANVKSGSKPISDMTFWELRSELKSFERRFQKQLEMPAVLPDSSRVGQRVSAKRKVDPGEAIRLQIHRQVAFSFACFGFTLVGIPLGIRVHRRETNIGVAIALGLMAIYYTMIIVAEALRSSPEWSPHLWMWLPNFLFQAVGAVLLWRANRGL